MWGEEAKIKKYDYMVYSEIKQRLKILTKEQVRFGDYDFMQICKIFNRFNIAFFACNLKCSCWFFDCPSSVIGIYKGI
jgi:hypothetical protein